MLTKDQGGYKQFEEKQNSLPMRPHVGIIIYIYNSCVGMDAV